MIDRFSEVGIDPVEAFQGSCYKLITTKDVYREIEALISSIEKRSTVETDETKLQNDIKKKALAEKVLKEVTPLSFFGFADPTTPGAQRCGGFGDGLFITSEQLKFLQEECSEGGKLRPTGIPQYRTDNDLAAMAARFWVITDNSKEKHWKKANKFPYLIKWSDLKLLLEKNNNDLVTSIDKITISVNKNYWKQASS